MLKMDMGTKVTLLTITILLSFFFVNVQSIFAIPFYVSIEPGTDVPGCEMDNQCFRPSSDIEADVGTEIIWINNDGTPHTITSGNSSDGPDGIFDSSMLASGDSFSFTFEELGTYDYFCMIHPWMVGTIYVKDFSSNPSVITVTVTTDHESYTYGNTITISGEVERNIPGVSLYVAILESPELAAELLQINLNSDNTFSTSTVIDRSLYKDGTYTVKVISFGNTEIEPKIISDEVTFEIINHASVSKDQVSITESELSIEDYDQICQDRFGYGFYYDVSNDACLPPSGSWQNPGIDYLNQQCEDKFWLGFYYDVSNDACLPPSGSWQNPEQSHTSSVEITSKIDGSTIFDFGDNDLHMTFLDEVTGKPIGGLSVAVQLDPIGTQGILVIIDPQGIYPTQMVILKVNGEELTMYPEFLSNFIANADNTPVTVPITSYGTSNMKTIVLNEIPIVKNPDMKPKSPIDLVKLTAFAIKALDQAGVPIADYAGNLDGIIKERMITHEQAAAEFREKVKDRSMKTVLFFVQPDFIKSLGKEGIPTPTSVYMDALNFGMDANAIYSCGLPNERVVVRESNHFVLYGCRTLTMNEQTSGLLRVAPEGYDERGLPLSTGSLNLISKTNIGLGFHTNLDINGKMFVSLPTGIYTTQITNEGITQQYRDIEIEHDRTYEIKYSSTAISSELDSATKKLIDICAGETVPINDCIESMNKIKSDCEDTYVPACDDPRISKILDDKEKTPEPTPEPNITINSASCVVSGFDEFGFTLYTLEVSGTISGPVKTGISVNDRSFGSSNEGTVMAIRCSDWPEIGAGNFCSRTTNDLSSTQWTASTMNNFMSGKTIEFVVTSAPVATVNYATTTAKCPDVSDYPDN